ncbi:PrsW family glutamic-type intramembrane protease [Enterovirga sp.]|uniref:PrsW family glutamic-type intramembrane protease n=1 Tax=Enterovirga sp. TaxID=2026350 RepID=UPI002D0B250E|nr:PrsW family glutamic-type intramembrane protease [Enterovirga sp.]HMO27717.1 PrsW family glutamic-type intramembrane protease [Enterovirga sp.]
MPQDPLPPQPPQREPELSRSDLIPVISPKVRLWRSKALIPIVLVTATSLVLFRWGEVKDIRQVLLYMAIVSACLLATMFVALYVYSGERKAIAWYAVPAAITYVQLVYFLGEYIHVFREILPGKTDGVRGFPATFRAMFFGAGLMEEVLKAVPALLALALALALRGNGSPGNVLTRGLALRGPVDGLLTGAAAGAMFIFLETVFQYVPERIGAYKDTKYGVIMGFMLLFPRIIKGVIGHIGYAGISGYFIGLAATHPRHAWKLVPVGIVTAALLHAFWNSADTISTEWGSFIAGPLIALVFLACLMKARQLEASRTGGAIDGQSILALSPGYGPGPIMPAGIVPPAPPGIAGVLAGAATAIERSVGVTSRTTEAPAEPAVPASGLAIGTANVRYALVPNPQVDLSTLFAADGAPPGCTAAIVAMPGGGMAICNTGSVVWSAAMPDGSAQPVHPGQEVPALAGTTLLLGGAVLGIGAY